MTSETAQISEPAGALSPAGSPPAAVGIPQVPPEPTRTKRAAWSYGSNVLFALVTMGVGLVTTPLLIRLLGTTRFGAVRAATDVAGYTGLLELGLGGAVLAMLAQAIGRGDVVRVNAVLKAALRSYRVVATLMVLVGAVIGLFIARLVPVPPDLRNELRLGFAVLVLSMTLTPLTVYRLFAEASQRGYVVVLLLTIQSIVTTGLCLLAAWAGFGLPGQFLATTMALLPTLLLLRRSARKRVGLNAAAPGESDREIRRELWTLSWPTFGLSICYRLSLLTDNVLVAWFYGPAAVVTFFATQRLATIAQSQLQGFTSATWAGFSHLDARGEAHRMEVVLAELTRLVVALGVAAVFPIMAYNATFVSLWVGKNLYGGPLLTIVACAVAVVLPITTLWSWVLAGSGRLQDLLPLSLISTAVNVPCSVLATWRLGLAGPLIGTLTASLLVNSWWLPILLRRHFGISSGVLAAAALKPVALAVPFICTWVFLLRGRPPGGWISLALHMAGLAIAYLIACWFLVFRPEDRDQLLSRLHLLR